jgi:hypothetical protein
MTEVLARSDDPMFGLLRVLRDDDLADPATDPGLPADVLEPRRAAIAPNPWTWLDQVHGARVVVVTRPGEHAGAAADAAVTVGFGEPNLLLPVLV